METEAEVLRRRKTILHWRKRRQYREGADSMRNKHSKITNRMSQIENTIGGNKRKDERCGHLDVQTWKWRLPSLMWSSFMTQWSERTRWWKHWYEQLASACWWCLNVTCKVFCKHHWWLNLDNMMWGRKKVKLVLVSAPISTSEIILRMSARKIKLVTRRSSH